jgi:ribA/ribD-fused uncharacterized protein
VPTEPPILGFSGQYRWLSNFAPARVRMDDGRTCATVEHAYQCYKTLDPDLRHQINSCRTPGEAKRWWKERRHLMRADWLLVNIPIMEGLTWQKYEYPDLRGLLLATGEAEIVEVNSWGDTFWGQCGGVGRNELGRVIMRTRDAINELSIPG